MKKTLAKVGTGLTLGFLSLSNAVSALAATVGTGVACGGTTGNTCQSGNTCTNNICVANSGSGGGNTLNLTNLQPSGVSVPSDASTLIKNVITIVFLVAAALTFFYLIWGAITWITSGGDKSKVEEARNRITAAVIGLLILAATWAIFQLVLTIAFGSTGLSVPNLSS